MKHEVNILSYNSTPLTASIVETDGMPKHMHGVTQIIVVLKGRAKIELEDESFELNEDDMFLINPYIIHSIHCDEKIILLSIMMRTEGFLEDNSNTPIYFDLTAQTEKKIKRLESIRYLLFSLIRINSINATNSVYNTKGIVYSLFAQLINDFQIKAENLIEKRNSFDTITKITSYINDNYKENISLQDLASYFGYTDTYISKLFKTSLNTTFIKYYDNVRVNHSLEELLKTSNSIESIAIKYGFENSRSYVRACNSVLNENPSDYRKGHRQPDMDDKDDRKLKEKALDIMLEKYHEYQSRNNLKENVRDTTEVIKVKNLTSYNEFINPANKILNLGGFTYIFNEGLRRSLSKIVKEIPYEYIKITDLFTFPELYKKNEGSYFLNKALIDNLLSIIDSLKLKPYFSFSSKVFDEERKKLITTFLDYVLEKGLFKNIIIQVDSKTTNYEEILQFYNKIKTRFSEVIVASPTITSLDDYTIFSEINTFFSNTCDLINISIKESLLNNIEKNSNYTLEFIKKLKREYYINKAKLVIEDISFTKNEYNYLNDTLYLSTFMIKTFFEIYNVVDYISFSPMFDLSINSFYESYPYLGYSGSFTYNNIKKASYNALKLISNLKSKVLKTGSNYFISYDNNKITILLNNYNHFSDLFADDEYYKLTSDERYTCFPKSSDILFKIEIDDVKYTKASIKTTYINDKSGSSYDIYKKIAGSYNLSQNEVEELKALSEPHFKIEQVEIINNELHHETITEPFESKLIEITLN